MKADKEALGCRFLFHRYSKDKIDSYFNLNLLYLDLNICNLFCKLAFLFYLKIGNI